MSPTKSRPNPNEESPETLLPALKQSADKLEAELLSSLRSHANEVFSAADTAITNVLSAIAPIEKSLNEADKLVENTFSNVDKQLDDLVENAIKTVQNASIDDLANRVDSGEGRGGEGGGDGRRPRRTTRSRGRRVGREVSDVEDDGIGESS